MEYNKRLYMPFVKNKVLHLNLTTAKMRIMAETRRIMQRKKNGLNKRSRKNQVIGKGINKLKKRQQKRGDGDLYYRQE